MEISKARKGSDEYLIDWCDYVIGDLVKEKTHLFKAYNYFNGVRDHYQYEHLEQNFGVGNPTSVSFTPLTKKHIEAIVGEYLTTKPRPKIACKDKRTLTNIFRDKQLEIAKKLKEYLYQFLENTIYEAIANNGEEQDQTKRQQDAEIKRQLDQLVEDVNRNFISNYEIAAQNLVQYILQDRRIDFLNKVEQLFLDLLISGEAYYQTIPTHSKKNFRIQHDDVLNTWVKKNIHSRYMKDGYSAVVRKWMSVEEIEIKYGNSLSEEDLKSLHQYVGHRVDDEAYVLITGQCKTNPGILNGVGVHPFDEFDGDPYHNIRWNLIPIYDVEWIDSYKEDGKFTGKNYHVTRIGDDIYILDDADKYQIRDLDDPDIPRLSVNGIWYTNGHGNPYSLMLATADLQDEYDLLRYQANNLSALSGTSGGIVDVASLPEFLGDDLEERIMKYQAYRKIGLALIDSSQEGSTTTPPNQIYNGFDDTRGLSAIQYIQLAINMIEDTVSSITGVFRERLGGIQQRDAVANVEVGMQQSYIITKRYYNAMDTLVREMISDSIDIAKIVYKDGLTGQLILGDQREIFTLLPKYYTATSFDIQLADSAEILKEQELIKQLAMQLAGQGQVDPEILLIVSTSKSLTEMKELTMKAIREKKIENDQVAQLTQQLEQAQQNMQQMQKQLEASTRKLTQLNSKKLAIEEQNNRAQQSIDYQKVQNDYELKNKELDLIAQRNKLEAVQLVDDNSQNDEVLNRRY